MRPVRLTMSAFGSYAGVQEIDFTQIHSGLFLQRHFKVPP